VTPMNITAITNPEMSTDVLVTPNPVTQYTTLTFTLFQTQNISLAMFDLTGRCIKRLYNGPLNAGEQHINMDMGDGRVKCGMYLLKLEGETFSRSLKLIVEK
jgi:hypothetical protein